MPIEMSDEGLARMTPEQRETVAFVEQMTGWTFSDSEPPADSPLGQLAALVAARDAGQITDAECRAAFGRIQREGLAEAVRNGEEPF